MPDMRWADVPVDATIKDRNGTLYKVLINRPAAFGRPPVGSLGRQDRTTIAVSLAPETIVKVVWLPPKAGPDDSPETAGAVALTREFFPGATLECERCTVNPDAECSCESHCGASHCVNFRVPLPDPTAQPSPAQPTPAQPTPAQPV